MAYLNAGSLRILQRPGLKSESFFSISQIFDLHFSMDVYFEVSKNNLILFPSLKFILKSYLKHCFNEETRQ